MRPRVGIILILMTAIMALSGCEDNAEPRQQSYGGDPAALGINPPSTTISSSNTYAIFQAYGGTPPYQWRISDITLGTIPDTYADAITYTRTGKTPGVNVISVVDRNNWFAEASVYQE